MRDTSTTEAVRRLFISYAGEAGKLLAIRVSRVLEAAGFDAAVPIQPIWEPDAVWDDTVIADIRASDGVIFIEPPEERAAPHVLFEVGAAHALGKTIIGVGVDRPDLFLDETQAEGVLHIYETIDATDMEDATLAAAIVTAFRLQ